MADEWLNAAWLKVKAFVKRRRLERDLEEELRFHLAMREEKNRGAGLDDDEAQAAARRGFGNITLVKEAMRTMWTFAWVENLWQAVIVATVPGHPGETEAPPIAELVDWKAQNHVFEDIALVSNLDEATIAGIGEPESLRVQYLTPNFFSLLGVVPERGRIFCDEEMQDKFQAILISDGIWKRKFNSDPNVLGQSVNIEGVVSTVVGVMPPGFAPFNAGRIDLWMPINAASPRYLARMDHWLMPVGRLKAGVTLEQAQREMDV